MEVSNSAQTLVLDVQIRILRKIKNKLDPKIIWWWLKEGHQRVFIYILPKAELKAKDDPDATWNNITSCIKRITKNVLGKSNNGAPPCKYT